eukprot:3560326-Amphidinium_carterae.1
MVIVAQDVSRVGLPVNLVPIEAYFSNAAVNHCPLPVLLPWVSIDDSAPLVAVLRAVSTDMLSAISNSGTVYGGYIETVRARVASVVVPNRGQLKIASRVKRSLNPSEQKQEDDKRNKGAKT